MQKIKRLMSVALVTLPVAALVSACKATAMAQRPTLSPAQKRLDGMGLTLVVDAIDGAEMLGVEFYADGSEFPFYASSVIRLGNREIMSFPSGVVPEVVRVVWRDSSELIRRKDDPRKATYAGSVLGNYSFAVASRIPDSVVQEIRKNGGGLRLKFRLHPESVLFGWDIERISGGLPRHSMADGDFREADIFNGKAVRKGWYIHPKTGQRIETDF